MAAMSQRLTPEALEDHFDRSVYPMLKHFHIAGAAVGVVCDRKEACSNQSQRVESPGDGTGGASQSQRNTKASTSGESTMSFCKGFGYDDLDSEKIVNIHTSLFDSGRCARLLCALALADLQQEGSISMKSRVSEYINDYGSPSKPVLTLKDLLVRPSGKPLSGNGHSDTDSDDIDWDAEADDCASQIIEKVSGMEFSSHIKKLVQQKVNMSLTEINENKVSWSGTRKCITMNVTVIANLCAAMQECFTYLYQKDKMLQLKTLQSKLLASQGLITTAEQMTKILKAYMSNVERIENSRGDCYDILPGFGFGFKSVQLWPGSPNVFVCVSAIQDNGNAIVCVEPRSRWAVWIACNTFYESTGDRNDDLFKGEPFCYFILKEFISELGFSGAYTESNGGISNVTDEMARLSHQHQHLHSHPRRVKVEWLHPPMSDNTDSLITLFCFPSIGSSGLSIFRSWFGVLPEFIEVRAVSLPGRGKRINDEPEVNLLLLAEQIAIGILPVAKTQQFAFFGSGIGGILAFEVSRYLKLHHDMQPICCFFAGTPSPITYDGKKYRNEAVAEILVHDESCSGGYETVGMDVVDKLFDDGSLPVEMEEDPLLLRAILPSITADLTMEAKYRYKRCPYKLQHNCKYFCESTNTSSASLSPQNSPRSDRGKIVRLGCPITVFSEPGEEGNDHEGDNAKGREKQMWEPITDCQVSIIPVEGSKCTDREHKAREQICSAITETVGKALTAYNNWVGWAARIQ